MLQFENKKVNKLWNVFTNFLNFLCLIRSFINPYITSVKAIALLNKNIAWLMICSSKNQFHFIAYLSFNLSMYAYFSWVSEDSYYICLLFQ